MEKIIRNINVVVENGDLSDEEVLAYIDHITAENPNEKIAFLKLTVDGEYVNAEYQFADVQFERIRRITGYLVGTIDRWNDAKQAELRDRVKHTTTKF